MKKIVLLASMLAVLSLVISCKSAPPAQPEPTPAPEQPAQPAAVPDPESERTQARSLQQKVDKYGLGTWAADDYQAATDDMKAGDAAYGTDNAASKKAFLAAIDAYNAVIAKGGPLLLADVQTRTDASKKSADDLKASVAVKDDYASALAVYNRAMQEKSAGDLESAAADLVDAQAQFDSVARVAQQKKDAATQAMESAQQDGTVSEKNASDAQTSLENDGFAPSGS